MFYLKACENSLRDKKTLRNFRTTTQMVMFSRPHCAFNNEIIVVGEKL